MCGCACACACVSVCVCVCTCLNAWSDDRVRDNWMAEFVMFRSSSSRDIRIIRVRESTYASCGVSSRVEMIEFVTFRR